MLVLIDSSQATSRVLDCKRCPFESGTSEEQFMFDPAGLPSNFTCPPGTSFCPEWNVVTHFCRLFCWNAGECITAGGWGG